MKADAMATEDLCSTKVIVYENVTITVKGTMIISGQLDGGGGGTAYAGQTAGYHARLVLKDDVLITVASGGALKLLGFIDDESTSTNKAEIEVRGAMYQPIVIRDFKGGSITAAAYKGMATYKFAPFNQFQFNNTDVKVIIYSGASFYNYANLYASDQHNTSIAAFIGSSSNFFIQLTQGARVEAEYDKSTDIIDIHFYGGATTNGFTLNAAGQTVTSSMFTFPISWLMHITLDTVDGEGATPATYNMMQDYKLLPGAILTVEKGATLNITTLNVYASFDDPLATGRYPAGKNEAKLIVNGTLIAGVLGGKVYTTNTDGTAKVKAISVASAKTFEMESVQSLSILSYVKKELPMEFALSLYNANGTLLNITTYAGVEYYSENGEWNVPPYFELQVGEGYSVTVKEWWIYDESGNLVKQTNSNGQTFTTGQSIYLPTSGASVTYTPASNYVVFTELSMDISKVGQAVTKTIYGPLQVKKALITNKNQITLNTNGISLNDWSVILVDANSDGICEVQVFVETKQSKSYKNAQAFKVNVNNETDDEGNLIYNNSSGIKGGLTGLFTQYERYTTGPIYGDDIIINLAKN